MFVPKKFAAIATAALLGGSANAQLGDLNLSGSCQAQAIQLLFGDLGSCLAITNGLLPLFTSSGSIVAPLDNYLNNNICGQAACSNETLTSANQTLNDNCQEDIQGGSTLIVGLQTIINEYSTVREVGCLQASDNNTRCVTQSLYAVQNATGDTIDVGFVTGLLGGGDTSLVDLATLDSSIVCTGCNQAIYQVASQNNGSSFTEGAIGRGIEQKCGSDFTSSDSFPANVNNPVNPTETGSATPGTSSSPAAADPTNAGNAAGKAWSVNGLTVIAAGAMSLAVVGGAFGVLA